MIIGDLVTLAANKTRRGYEWEKSAGIIVDIQFEIIAEHAVEICDVNFGGQIHSFAKTELVIVGESE